MIRYFDASALVKRYVREPGSASVRRWLSGGTAATARYSLVEVASALARRSRAGDLAPGDAERLLASLTADAGSLLLVEFTARVEAGARALLAVHRLRAGDALQLASCLHLRERSGEDVEFVGYDARLGRAARSSGLRTRGARP